MEFKDRIVEKMNGAVIRKMVETTLKVIDAKEGDAPEKAGTILGRFACYFLRVYVQTLVARTLVKSKDITVTQEQYQKVVRGFATAKMQIQDAVANAFQDAMGKFVEKEVEYFVTIKTYGEPINKKDI